jgi:hypothetical protein
MTPEWNLSYEAWIIGDGEPHRTVGEVFEWFAVAFWTWEPLEKSDKQSRSAVVIPDFKYQTLPPAMIHVFIIKMCLQLAP